MKRLLLATLLFASPLLAQGEEKEPADGMQLLNSLIQANEQKNITDVANLAVDISTFAKSAGSEAEVEPLAAELAKSLKVAKGNFGTLRKIIGTLGELRTKQGAKALKKIAFQRKAKDEQAEELQAAAILAISIMRDPKLVDRIADQMKSRSIPIAKAAMESFKNYSPAKGKVRKKVAEVLMKRMEAEYPSAASGKTVSAEAQKRWQQVSPVIVGSMQAICRQTTITDVDNWREWWKENKKRKKTWQDKKP